ncbi:MAG: hypothetical protein A3I05_09440 [Deltaproteobacteria bacterium RIFCSPLOWO2_02_FULL_44_10]|nr:MAG: hypothetical protein A3C46_07540 [Deltaproteobacteria bacterium RIFCSPHIGHO2_02_FULL_44_16]OGQ47435.1 MAG: hypothetical protein A3I05_09440 [Deltaproteobacteria bacterium RIFCSPLOWO2_02_FULL_44_10]
MSKITRFDAKKQHIHTWMRVKSSSGKEISFSAILDTGAPFTEISDRSLARAGFHTAKSKVQTKDLQETQKYGKIRLPLVTVLGEQLADWVVYVSRFDEKWNIDALIGLDFFRRFRVTIDYAEEILITDRYNE